MPVTRAALKEPSLPRDTRMTLLGDEVISEYKPYRFKAGTVILVDAETAQRWRENNVAVDSAETDKTAAEQKRARIADLQREIEALESGEAVGEVGIEPEITQARSRRTARR
jgi:hypothetical protein